MKLYISQSKTVKLHYQAKDIKEAHEKARNTFGQNVSFTTREATQADIIELEAESQGTSVIYVAQKTGRV